MKKELYLVFEVGGNDIYQLRAQYYNLAYVIRRVKLIAEDYEVGLHEVNLRLVEKDEVGRMWEWEDAD